MKWYHYILMVVACLLWFALGVYECHRYHLKHPTMPTEAKVDTLYIRDTITSYKPKFVERVKLDSVLVPVIDSVKIHDTTFVYLEREQVVWQDSLSVVYASGILPQVDSVRHFQESMTIIKEIPVVKTKKTHWGLGVQAGVGAGKDGLTPYIGVGVSYNILSW